MTHTVRHLPSVPHISLTGADFFDLAAGFSFNALCDDGDEINLYGEEFAADEIQTLARGEALLYYRGGEDYLLTAPEEPWADHHSLAELQEAWAGPYAERLKLLGLQDPFAAPAVPPLGVRHRRSPLAERVSAELGGLHV